MACVFSKKKKWVITYQGLYLWGLMRRQKPVTLKHMHSNIPCSPIYISQKLIHPKVPQKIDEQDVVLFMKQNELTLS